MTSRPILFSGPMVRALLDGSKTQTRRVFKAKNGGVWPNKNDLPGMRQILRNCPYGQPGDQLWVRETWARTVVGTGTAMVVYREGDNRTDYGGPWKPGIHMFQRDSRITLEITGVRVERLLAISKADAMAEGLVEIDRNGVLGFGLHESDPLAWHCPVGRYQMLWESINGLGSWDLNPWVWVIEFKRVAP